MPAYYNEIDPHAAQWLRNLIAAGYIAPGDVDTRSITEVHADDLAGYEQCHFFAGIGGWSYALRLAGWPDDRPVWTGSCPCQPFSTAGHQRGSDDERHLWPAFFDLIRKCQPSSVFGEQVAGAAGLAWLDHVCADLEGAGYAAAAADLCAAGVGAPHIRQRLYWVAHAAGIGQRWEARQFGRLWAAQRCEAGILGDSGNQGLEKQRRLAGVSCGEGRPSARQATERADALAAWAGLKWIKCSDGKARPTEPGIFPLAHGVPGRVGRLRAYGNAIVPQVAAVFVMANVRAKPGAVGDSA